MIPLSSSPALPQTIDELITARWIVPVEPANVILENHALAVDRGRILALLPVAEATQRFQARLTTALDQHLLTPGFVNLHTHAAMALFRGFADDLPLMRWLQEHIWPAEGKLVSPEFVRDGTLLASAEMLKGGITCFNDMYFYPEAAAEAASQLGIRAALGILAIEFPTRYAADADDYLRKGLAIRDSLLDNPLISFCLAPHAPYTVANGTFERVVTLAAQLDLPIHIHVHETCDEIDSSLVQHGVRPLERLHRLGVVGPNLIAVHAVHLESEEIRLLAEHGATVAHCPTSNMKLASGIAPVAHMAAKGLRVGLGTDGAASNNRLDLFHEMRHAALLAKVSSGDATALDAHSVLRMATLYGATALGLEGKIGSLEAGKAADLCATRLDSWEIQPCFDPVSHLIHAAGREHVTDVWVNGKKVVNQGNVISLNEFKLLDSLRIWQNKIPS
ncbi:MAG: TRZ/ATZ family hydrolase [Rhodocyclaceae bacterium]|nr:TRZ/ATZ family hydrolase [Rhodocyclaceae bacterium]